MQLAQQWFIERGERASFSQRAAHPGVHVGTRQVCAMNGAGRQTRRGVDGGGKVALLRDADETIK